MEPSPRRVASRHLANLCNRQVATAWIDPNGKVIPLDDMTHEDFALRWYIDRHPQMFADLDADEIEYLHLPHHHWEAKDDSYLEILEEGWIRVSNWTNFEVANLHKPSSAAWKAAAEFAVGCMVRDRGSPEEVTVHVGYGWDAYRASLPDFVERFGDRRLVDEMFRRLLR